MPDKDFPGDFRQRIQDFIKEQKITQAEYAEKVGFSRDQDHTSQGRLYARTYPYLMARQRG